MAFTFGAGGGAPPFGTGGGGGAFGQKPAQTFGAFGAAKPTFGTPARSTFGAPAFGAATPVHNSSASVFQSDRIQQQQSPFGKPPGQSLFGGGTPATTASTFGGGTTPSHSSNIPHASDFRSAAATPFGTAATTGGGGLFGSATSSGATGTTQARYQTQQERTMNGNKSELVTHTAITLMPQYREKSFEQLRAEDYANRTATGGFALGAAAGAATPFGAAAAGAAPTFGQPAAGGLFGAATKPAFGAATTPAFGAAPTFGGAAAGAKTFAFGQTGAATGAATFGAAAGAGTSAFGGGAFGAKPATGFGQTSAFGQPAAGAAGAFGAKPATFGAFGAATPAAGAFGQPAAGASTFSFGNTAAKPFGAATTAATATPAFGFGNTAAKPFGTPATTGGFQFGQPAAAATPAFGTTGGLFGTTGAFGQKPATPGFGFGVQQPQQQLQQQVVLVPPTHPLLQIKSPLPYGPEPQSTPNPYAESAAEATAALNGLSKSSASERARLAVANSSQHYKMTPRVASRLLPRGYGTPSSLGAERQHGGADTPGVRDLAAVSELLVPRHSVKKLVIEAGGENDADDDAAALAAITRARAPVNYDEPFGAPPPFRLGDESGFAVKSHNNNNNNDKSVDNDDDADVDHRGGAADDDFVLAKRSNLFAHEQQQQQLQQLQQQVPAHDVGPADMDEIENDVVGDADDDDDAVGDDDGKRPSTTTPLKSRTADDLLPRLTRADYYVTPSLRELAAMSGDELAHVSPFVVGHRDFGSVEWTGGVDCRRLNLDELVHFFPASVEVYPEGTSKPSVGRGLNQRARVTLTGVLPLAADGSLLRDAESLARFRRRIERSTSKLGARLIAYNDETGEWRFEVDHFSRYGLVDDDEDGGGAIVAAPPPPPPSQQQAPPPPPAQLAAWQRKHRRVATATDEIEMDDEATANRSQLQRGAVLPQQLGFDARSMQILRHGLFGSLTDESGGAGDTSRLLMGFLPVQQRDTELSALPEPPTVATFGAAEAHRALRRLDVDDEAARADDARDAEPPAAALVNVAPFLPPPPAVPAALSTLALAPTCRAGGAMGRSARVGWCGGSFAVVRASGRVDVMRVTIPDAVAPSKVALLLDAHRRASNCLAVAGGEGGPLWQMADARAFLHDVVSPRVDGGELWRLADALWDEDVHGGNEATVERQRKRALDEWLERQCSAELAVLPPREPTGAASDDWLDDVFDLMCRRRIGAAAAACVRGGELRLATLVAQAGCGPSADVRAQIELWTRQARFVQFSAPRQRLYRLLAGDVRAVCATIAATRSWRVALALHSWYAQLERDSVAAAFSVYSASTDAGFCAHPFPDWLVRARRTNNNNNNNNNDNDDDDDEDDVFDTAYLLIRLFVQRSTLLGVVCDPRAYCRKGLDYLPAWCLHSTLATLGYPALPRSAELSSALARQLDTDETWQWALYALLCAPPVAAAADGAGARRARALELLGRHGAALLPLDGGGGDARRSALYVFLRDELLVPAQWLETAIAWHARAVGDVRLLPQALLLAGEWQLLHECVLRDVAARAILASTTETGASQQIASLRVLLEALREHRDVLAGWTTGGAILLDFLDCERDVAQWRRREALGAADTEAGARKRQLEALLARVRGVAVLVRALSLADAPTAAAPLTATLVGVDGAPRAALPLDDERRRVEADACRTELAARTAQLLLAVCALLAHGAAANVESDWLLNVCPTLLALPLTEDFRLQTCAQLVQQ